MAVFARLRKLLCCRKRFLPFSNSPWTLSAYIKFYISGKTRHIRYQHFQLGLGKGSMFTVKKKRDEYTSVKVLGAVKDVSIPQEPGGGDGDTRDHEPGEHPGAEVQLTQGH